LLIVMKFGGATIKELGYSGVRELIDKVRPKADVVVVVSAVDGVTDTLDEAARRAMDGDEEHVKRVLEDLRKLHLDLIQKSLKKDDAEAGKLVGAILTELERALYGIMYLGELTRRSLDHVLSFGETISCKLGAHLLTRLGTPAVGLTGKEAGITTDEEFGNARPLMNLTWMKVNTKVTPLLREHLVPVVGGFCGSTQDGHVTTLGRGGSDYTATILASALKADEVWLWTDVNGIMSADPKIVSEAVTIPELTYREATELFLLGGKFMHPRTLIPVAPLGIPVIIKNAFNPEGPGTVIGGSAQPTGRVVKAVSLIRDVVMFNLMGPSMSVKAGTAGTIFQSLATAGAEAIMIAQSASESNVSIVVKRELAEKVYTNFELNLLGKVVDELKVDEDVCVVAAVGEGMKGTPGVAAKVFDAVSRNGINVKMIAASSELNISFAVSKGDGEDAVKAVHEAFELNRIG
jgi:aspartate kinase